jgi:hypothetical protein
VGWPSFGAPMVWFYKPGSRFSLPGPRNRHPQRCWPIE